MYTSAFVVLASLSVPEAPPATGPQWVTSYSQARKKSRTENLPLALFFGVGDKGFAQVSSDGKLPQQVLELLAKYYVAAYLSCTEAEVRELAEALGVKRGRGLILTDRGGQHLEFSHDGPLSAGALADVLVRHADAQVPVSAEGKCITLTSANFATEVLQSEKPVLVDFWAEWCGPCRRMIPVLADLGLQFRAQAKIAKLNIDEHRAIAQQYNITAMPTFLIFQNGQVVDRVVGATSQSSLAAKLNALLQK